jgi:hypothetical protein
LYDNSGNLLETSGVRLHNSSEDLGTKQKDTWSPIKVLDHGSNYSLTFDIVTINGYKGAI